MARESKLTKVDVFNFLNLGRKIVSSGAGSIVDAAKSKIAELTDSEDAFQKRVTSQLQALRSANFSEEEARKAVEDRMKNRLDKAFEKCVKDLSKVEVR